MSDSQPPRPLVEQFAHAVRAYSLSLQVVTGAAAEQLGLNATDHRCLEIIERIGGLTAGRLAEASGLSTGAVTTVLDHLEEAGYVRRLRDPADRRRVLVAVTPDGHRRGQAIYGPLLAASRAMLAEYSDAELELLTGFLRRGREFNLAQAERIRAMSDGAAPDA